MAILANQAAGFLNTGKVPQRQGNSHPSLAPYQDFPTADGAMLLAIGNDGQFARFCHAVDKPEWAADPRFATMGGAKYQPWRADSRSWKQSPAPAPPQQWITLLEDKAVPCGPINDIGQAFADEQVKARNLEVKQAVVSAGVFIAKTAIKTISTVASPLRLTATPPVLLVRRRRWGSIRMRCWRSWG